MATYLRSIFAPRNIKGPFDTHLNYVKCLERLLSGISIEAVPTGRNQRSDIDIRRYIKLASLTFRSLAKDMELAKEDAGFAAIAAPWFPVKCYYALYYLESVLCHLLDGSTVGFAKGGHAGIRKRISILVSNGTITFSAPFNRPIPLDEIESYKAISRGMNTRPEFWKQDTCVESILKKLLEYKLADAKIANRWNLHKPGHQKLKREYVSSGSLMLLDYFFWYRLKANYKDVDYIDFEKGITEMEALGYLESYFKAFNHYYSELLRKIEVLV